MPKAFLLGIDQGTSGSKAVIIDDEGQVHGYGYSALPRLHPHPDWVEQEPNAVAEGVAAAITAAIGEAGCAPQDIAACGITCQRNTDFVWDARHGRALANAITWQDLRTLPLLADVMQTPLGQTARHHLGYAPGPYMSALHLAWRLQHDTAVIEAAQTGDLRIGLSAAWLLTALGRPSAHVMDASLIQATGLYDFRHNQYWQPWLEHWHIPTGALAQPVPTLHEYGSLTVTAPDGATADLPVLAMIGDQQAALFGQSCRQLGEAECTHGTASFVKVFLDEHMPKLDNIDLFYAWNLNNRQTFLLEAPTTATGAVIRWMRDSARFFDDYAAIEALATAVPNASDLIFIPAFTGTNAPFNDPLARGTILGLTLGHERGHIIRAFMESLAYQIRAILENIHHVIGLEFSSLRVGGGVSASDLSCQIQADLLGMPVNRPSFTETTAWAAALLAGLAAGTWPTVSALPPLPGSQQTFWPQMAQSRRDDGYERWLKAVALMQKWAVIGNP